MSKRYRDPAIILAFFLAVSVSNLLIPAGPIESQVIPAPQTLDGRLCCCNCTETYYRSGN